MNLSRLVASLSVILFVTANAIASEGRFFTEVITDQPVRIEVRKDRSGRIINFIQDANLTARGAVTVSRSNGPVMSVFTAVLTNETDWQKDVVIAGPAVISVEPVAGAKLFLTYRIENN
jgi:hypothetical protein